MYDPYGSAKRCDLLIKAPPRVHAHDCRWTLRGYPCSCDVRDTKWWPGSEEEALAWANVDRRLELLCRARREREAEGSR